MVGDNTFQEAMEFLVIMKEESGCSFCCDCCACQNEVYSFGDSIHDCHDSIVSRRLWELNHKINTKYILLCIRNGERLELTDWRVLPRFCPETEIAGTYILADVPRHLGPPVVLGYYFQCLLASRVSCDLGIVAKGYNLPA